MQHWTPALNKHCVVASWVSSVIVSRSFIFSVSTKVVRYFVYVHRFAFESNLSANVNCVPVLKIVHGKQFYFLSMILNFFSLLSADYNLSPCQSPICQRAKNSPPVEKLSAETIFFSVQNLFFLFLHCQRSVICHRVENCQRIKVGFHFSFLSTEICRLGLMCPRGKPNWPQRWCFCSGALRSCVLSHETKRGTKIKTLNYTTPRHCRNILLCTVP